MRRRHNVVAATLLVLGVVYLCARREGDLLDQSNSLKLNEVHDISGKGVSFADAGNRGQGTHAHSGITPQPTTIVTSSLQEQPFAEFLVSKSSQLLAEKHPATVIQPILPSHTANPFSEANDGAKSFKTDYAFQNDLNLDLPVSILQKFSKHAPHNYDPNGTKTNAYATFMATRNPSLRDPYFLAICSLIHRILWSPQSRTQRNYPFIVFVAEFVTQEQRALLSGAGAIVRELKPLAWHCDAPNFESRWQDLFAKLNIWAEIDFDRILFLDADAFPLANIDDMFDIAALQECIGDKLAIDDFLPDRTPVCEPYVFAGVAQDPFSATYPNINVGSMVFTPSLRMHQRLVQNYGKTDHYDCAMAEQAFLNWQFSVGGAYPSTKLDRQWGGFFPREEEEGKLKIVHEKMWVIKEGWMRREWEKGWEEMVEWFESAEFGEQRTGGLDVSGQA